MCENKLYLPQKNEKKKKNMEESISIEEIRELALRYIQEDECGVIPARKDAFALLIRPILAKKK